MRDAKAAESALTGSPAAVSPPHLRSGRHRLTIRPIGPDTKAPRSPRYRARNHPVSETPVPVPENCRPSSEVVTVLRAMVDGSPSILRS